MIRSRQAPFGPAIRGNATPNGNKAAPPLKVKITDLKNSTQQLLLTENISPGNYLGALFGNTIDWPANQKAGPWTTGLAPYGIPTPSPHGKDRLSYLFADGHAETMTPAQSVKAKINTPEYVSRMTNPKSIWTRDPND